MTRGRRAAALACAAAAALAGGPAPATAQTPIAGGGSFNDAPLLEPGSYADTLRGGEQLFYAVELQPGQMLEAKARVEGRSTTSYFMALALYTTQREQAGEGTESWGPQDREVELQAQAEPATTGGPAYVSLVAREGGTAEAPEQFDTRVDIAVTGEGSPTPTPSPSPTPTATAEPRDGGGANGFPLGAAAGGLLLGLVAGFAGRRLLARR